MTNDRNISSKSESNFYASRKSLFQWFKLYPNANEAIVNKLWDEYEWDLFHDGQEEIVPDNFNEIFAGKDWHSIVNH